MNFASDNTSGAHPRVMAALMAANDAHVPSYGADALTDRVTAMLRETLAAPQAEVSLVATGTAANALALSLFAPGWGKVFCHDAAHIQSSETGAPEFFTGGAKLCLVPGADGRITPTALQAALDLHGRDSVHSGQRSVLSLTNATEAGTVYSGAQTGALAALAREHGMAVHVDGARFANAVAAQGGAAADLLGGVDVLSFGGTKNGAMGVEAVVVLDGARAAELAYRRKRGGHLFSKHRFLAAQMVALLADGLWLELAAHANAMAAELGAGLAQLGIAPDQPVESNQVFVTLARPVHDRLRGAGATFHPWPHDAISASKASIRLVTSWATRDEDVTRFLDLVRAA